VFYVQYAHARIRSDMRTATERAGWAALSPTPTSPLLHSREGLELLRVLASYRMSSARRDRSAHANKVTTWVAELAAPPASSTMLRGWRGVSAELTQAGSGSSRACGSAVVALSLLGFSAPESM